MSTTSLLFTLTSGSLAFYIFFGFILVVGIFFGIMLAPKAAELFEKGGNGNLPTEVAKAFIHNFKHRRLFRLFYPKTDCVVHNYREMRDYILSLEDDFNQAHPPHHPKPYHRGIALYLAKANHDNYVRKLPNRTACVEKRNYTVILAPVFYTEKHKKVQCKKPASSFDNTGRQILKTEFDVLVIDDLKSPLDGSLAGHEDFKAFADRFVKRFDDPIDGDAYDLGHTHP